MAAFIELHDRDNSPVFVNIDIICHVGSSDLHSESGNLYACVYEMGGTSIVVRETVEEVLYAITTAVASGFKGYARALKETVGDR